MYALPILTYMAKGADNEEPNVRNGLPAHRLEQHDMRAISAACLLPLRTGNPDTTTFA